MATRTPQTDKASTATSVYRSFITQYWPFTAYVLSYVTVGAALAGAHYDWDWGIVGATLGGIWFGLEGLHALDLAGDDIALRMNGDIQTTVGVLGLVIGAGIGIAVAAMTTWLFLVFIAAEVTLGLAYNLEWYDGALHDFDTPTGLANFGMAWGAIPFLAGYFVLAETITLGAVLMALGIALDAMRLIRNFEVSKPAPYEDLDIEYDRDIEQDTTLMNEIVYGGNKLSMASWALIAIGLVLMFPV